jgi:hypothetical protein
MNIIELKPWRVYEFPWGIGIKHTNGKWERVYLFPDAQEIDVSNLKVELNDEGIIFF